MAHPTPASKETWQPTASDIITIVALVGAVIMWYVQPSWGIGAPVTIITIIVVIAAAVRHQSHPLIRIPIACAVVLVLIGVAWRPIWTSFRKDYPRAAFNWPITLNSPPLPTTGPATPTQPPDMPPTNLPGPPLSRWGNAMFLCPYLPTVSDQDPAAAKALYRRNAEIYGKALNFDIVLSDIAYGIRIDVTARGSEGQVRMAGILRYTIQLESASSGIFVTISMELPGAMAILGQLPMERGSDIEKMWEGQLEQFGFPPGQCRLL